METGESQAKSVDKEKTGIDKNEQKTGYIKLNTLIRNLTAYQEDHRTKNQIPNSIWETYSSFANPGDMRPGLKTALSGGTSDARNSTIMKMFGLLDFGERAGSGIPDMFDICKAELGAQPEYSVTYAPARTLLTVDISEMEEMERTIKVDDNVKMDDKRTIKADSNGKTDDKRTIIVDYIRKNSEAKTEDLVKILGSSTTRTKVLLYQLVDEGVLVACGGNRNRTYKLKEES